MKKTVVVGYVFFLFCREVPTVSGQSGENIPPDLYSQFTIGEMSLPVPLSPVGLPLAEGAEKDVTFEWTKINAANAYTLWIEDANGKKIAKILKTELGISPGQTEGKFECGEYICKTTGVVLTSREGQWWIQAINLTEQNKSGWSKAGIFKSPEISEDKYTRCVKPLDDNGNYPIYTSDLHWTHNNWSDFTQGEWTVGIAALAQVIKYNFAKKEAGFNNGLGAGASFRFYKDVYVPGQNEQVPISRIKSECRATTFRLRDENNLPDASPIFSLTPTIFASQLVGEDDLQVEPAFMLGFFEDIINFGVGFNLTGKSGEKGDVFLLFSLGAGFNYN